MINSIHKLSLENFIDCLVDQDYKSLGDGTPEEIAATWADLLDQFNDSMGDSATSKHINASAQYLLAKTKYEQANRYIELLNDTYVPKWGEELNKLVNAKIVFNPHNREEYFSQLKNCHTRNKGNLFNLQLLEQDLLAFVEVQNSKKDSAPDRGYFTKVMVNLKNHNAREIPYTISVYEFCVLVNQFTAENRQQEAQHGRR
jgi:hypothetical protein